MASERGSCRAHLCSIRPHGGNGSWHCWPQQVWAGPTCRLLSRRPSDRRHQICGQVANLGHHNSCLVERLPGRLHRCLAVGLAQRERGSSARGCRVCWIATISIKIVDGAQSWRGAGQSGRSGGPRACTAARYNHHSCNRAARPYACSPLGFASCWAPLQASCFNARTVWVTHYALSVYGPRFPPQTR